jgi:hypothetical protein
VSQLGSLVTTPHRKILEYRIKKCYAGSQTLIKKECEKVEENFIMRSFTIYTAPPAIIRNSNTRECGGWRKQHAYKRPGMYTQF